MKKFNLLKTAAFAALVIGLSSCNDQFVDDIAADAQGNGAAKPIKTIGTGGETVFLNTTVNFDSDTIYLLDGFVKFRTNSILNIEPGTIIKGTDGNGAGEPGTLVIERTAQIFASGTPTNPIIMTSNKPAGSRVPGDWGGVILCGLAYSNVISGTTGSVSNYEGQIEGVPTGFSPIRYGVAGQSDPTVNYNDNSGVMQYVRIEFAGNVLSEGEETNGLTLGGVGAGTTIDHIQVSYGSDDGYEWFGGTVDQKYLIAYRNADDDFDADQGYYGRTQFGFILRDPDSKGTGSGGSRAFECNGDDDAAVNLVEDVLADPAYSNVTAIGPMGSTVATGCTTNWTAYNEYNDGIVIRDDAQLDLMNSVVAGFPRHAVNFSDVTDYNQPSANSCEFFKNRLVYTTVVDLAVTPSNIANATIQINNELRKVTGCDNPAVDQAGKAGLKRAAWRLPLVAADPQTDFTIVSTSPLNGNTTAEQAKFTSTRFVNFGGTPYKTVQDNNTFWDKSVLFRGAAGTTTGNWGTAWINWTPNVPAYD
jgi:hypothetical protein